MNKPSDINISKYVLKTVILICFYSSHVMPLEVFADDIHDPVTVLMVSGNDSDQLEFDTRLKAFERAVTSRVKYKGLRIINLETVQRKIAALPVKQLSTRKHTEFEKTKRDIASANLSTLLQMGQSLDITFIISLSIINYLNETYPPIGNMKRETIEHHLTTGFEILSVADRASVVSDIVEIEKTNFVLNKNTSSLKYVLDGLLNDSSKELGKSISHKFETSDVLRKEVIMPQKVPLVITPLISDLGNVPHIIKNDDGEYVVSVNQAIIEVLDVNVILDGNLIGSAGHNKKINRFSVYPGRHLLRIEREGFKPFERDITVPKSDPKNRNADSSNSPDGFWLTISLVMDDKGYDRMKENLNLILDLKVKQKLTDAQVGLYEAFAENVRKNGLSMKSSENFNQRVKGLSALDALNKKQ